VSLATCRFRCRPHCRSICRSWAARKQFTPTIKALTLGTSSATPKACVIPIRSTTWSLWTLTRAYAPWLTATGNLSANIEFQDFITLDDANSMMENFGPYTGGALEPESNIKNNVSTLFNVGTSWLWYDIAPTWTMIFSPKGRTFLLFSSIVLNPPWDQGLFSQAAGRRNHGRRPRLYRAAVPSRVGASCSLSSNTTLTSYDFCYVQACASWHA
jgi:hypothetical protein